MKDDHIKEAVAPCGLNCETCFAHVNGDIRRYSGKLKEALGNFEPYARRFETLLDASAFKAYPDFKAMLDYFASENCQGCRNEQCKMFKNCGVRPCHQARQVDYCHQCDDFPCDQTNFDPLMYSNWVRLNEKIKRVGLEEFYAVNRNRPRYA
jgi:hypothetical protein